MSDEIEIIEKKLVARAKRRAKKKKPEMKVSGKKVFELKRLIEIGKKKI